MISECCGVHIKWHDICSACGEHTDAIDEDEIVYLEQIQFEEQIVEVTGWSWLKFNDMLDEVCRDGMYHPDDDRQEAIEQLVLDLNDNARDWMLPEYVKKFEKEIKEIEECNKTH